MERAIIAHNHHKNSNGSQWGNQLTKIQIDGSNVETSGLSMVYQFSEVLDIEIP